MRILLGLFPWLWPGLSRGDVLMTQLVFVFLPGAVSLLS